MENEGDPASAFDEPSAPIQVHISDLPDAINMATYERGRHVLIVDNAEGMASRFLRYQRGCYLLFHNQDDITPESLRKNLVGALKFGSFFVLSFDELPCASVDQLFTDDACFPQAAMRRTEVFKKETWGPLLRPDEGDPAPHLFIPLDSFKMIFITRKDPPQEGLAKLADQHLTVIRIKGGSEGGEGGDGTNDQVDGNGNDAALASMFGVSLVKRNSEPMADAAFDGDLAAVQEELDKGFDLESAQKDGATALSEASAQGHTALVQFLIDLGADPNAQNDQGRSPLFRASFNGHIDTVRLLLSVGGDPDLNTKDAEAPYMVAKDEATRLLIDEWDREQVVVLKKEREEKIRAKMEERLTNAAERDAFAKEQIRKMLCKHAAEGSVAALKEEIENLVREAEKENQKRPRGSVQVRDERGQTLLMIACQNGKADMVAFLCEHWKTIEDDMFTGCPGMDKRAFRTNVSARDSKGWNAASVAAFHGHKPCLLKVLEHGADPRVKNSYGKDAFAVVKTEKDLLGAVLREGRPEILETLEMWEAEQQAARILGGAGGDGGASEGGADSSGAGVEVSLVDKAKAEGTQDAGPVALQQEMAAEASSVVGAASPAGGGAAAAKALKKKKKSGKAGKKKKKKKSG